MAMNRRAFFAALVAPVVAPLVKYLPNPKGREGCSIQLVRRWDPISMDWKNRIDVLYGFTWDEFRPLPSRFVDTHESEYLTYIA